MNENNASSILLITEELLRCLTFKNKLFCKYSVPDTQSPIMFLISTMVYSVVGGCVK